ncbi:hypothetical protein C5167_018968 [Papaver somniferum]|uniref:Uncharacterized protein n=1 Tax=Papaver somniferum TaxID=3469 RepID=A0A4Y7INT1_PAPSO|nr:hypothetical protein C5167_018968 [Papaver somniferum]
MEAQFLRELEKRDEQDYAGFTGLKTHVAALTQRTRDDEFSGSMMFHKQQRGPRVRLPKPPSLSTQRPACKMSYRDNSHSPFNVDKHQPQPVRIRHT